MQKRRGCRGRAAKRRSREKWLEKTGAEFVISHQELEISGGEVLVDKGVGISAVEAVLFYVNDPAATFALNVFLTKLKSNDDSFYKNSFRV